MAARFRKAERLHAKKEIDLLFREGKYLRQGCLGARYVFLGNSDWPHAKYMVVVPKKRLRKAVQRNRIKRQLRESIRSRKENPNTALAASNKRLHLAVIYLGGFPADFDRLNRSMEGIFALLLNEVNKN